MKSIVRLVPRNKLRPRNYNAPNEKYRYVQEGGVKYCPSSWFNRLMKDTNASKRNEVAVPGHDSRGMNAKAWRAILI